ncbi:hypothetical protein ABPG73_005657 [Tetrahymena malaccensis]
MDILKKRNSRNIIGSKSVQNINARKEDLKDQDPADIQEKEYQSYKQFDTEFSQILQRLQLLQNKEQLLKLNDNQIKELCQKIYILIFDWQKQTKENQEIYCRESLLQGLISLLINLQSVKGRARILKQSLQMFRVIGYQRIVDSNFECTESIITNEDYLELVITVLKEIFNYTKDKEIISILVEEGIFGEVVETLQSLKAYITPKYNKITGIDILYIFIQILKNLANEEKLRYRFFEKRAMEIISGYLHHFELNLDEKDEDRDSKIMKLYSQITALLRNLAVDINCTRVFLEFGIIDKLCLSIVLYPNEQNELMLNTMRILSKISLNKECSLKIFENQDCIKNICSLFKIFKTNIFIIIRISFIFANITTYNESIRNMIYFQFNAFKDIYNCFEYYAQRELTPLKNETVDKLGLSTAAWDFKIMQKESDSEALIKLLRLIANLMTVQEIGTHLITKKGVYYHDLIKKCKLILQKYKDINEKNSEIINCVLSCLANVTFYDKQAALTNDFEQKNIKSELVIQIGSYIMQNDSEDICCEALRVLSNLSRSKDLIKQIIKFKLLDAVILLLDSNSKDIVYYAIGTLINLTNSEDIKKQMDNSVMESLLQIVEDCTLDDNDLISITLKCVGNIMENNNKIQQDYTKKIEAALMKYGEECDIVISHTKQETDKITEIYELRGLINQILNSIPEEMYACLVPNCGRKFKEHSEYIKHMQRRHNL